MDLEQSLPLEVNPSPISEVGSKAVIHYSNTPSEEEKWRKLFEVQQQTLVEFLKIMKGTETNWNGTITGPILPEFNPEESTKETEAWCTAADMCLHEKRASGARLLMLLKGYLKDKHQLGWPKSAVPTYTNQCNTNQNKRLVREKFWIIEIEFCES